MSIMFEALKKANLVTEKDKKKIHADLVERVVDLEAIVAEMRGRVVVDDFRDCMVKQYSADSDDSIRAMIKWLRMQLGER